MFMNFIYYLHLHYIIQGFIDGGRHNNSSSNGEAKRRRLDSRSPPPSPPYTAAHRPLPAMTPPYTPTVGRSLTPPYPAPPPPPPIRPPMDGGWPVYTTTDIDSGSQYSDNSQVRRYLLFILMQTYCYV
jgi:hypothetical protein